MPDAHAAAAIAVMAAGTALLRFLPFAVERGFTGCWKAEPQVFSIIVEWGRFRLSWSLLTSLVRTLILIL